MQLKLNLPPLKHAVRALRPIGRATLVTALASSIFLVMWSPTSAEIAGGHRHLPGMTIESALPIGHEQARSKDADTVASAHGDWLRTAHSRVAATAEAESLPSQF